MRPSNPDILRESDEGGLCPHGRHHPAGHPCAAAAKRRGRVRVVVAARVNHQRTAVEIAHPHSGSDHRSGSGTGRVDRQRRQVAEMTVPVGTFVTSGVLRVVVAARVLSGHPATGVHMHVEPVLAGGEAGQIRRKARAVGCLLHTDRTDRRPGRSLRDVHHDRIARRHRVIATNESQSQHEHAEDRPTHVAGWSFLQSSHTILQSGSVDLVEGRVHPGWSRIRAALRPQSFDRSKRSGIALVRSNEKCARVEEPVSKTGRRSEPACERIPCSVQAVGGQANSVTPPRREGGQVGRCVAKRRFETQRMHDTPCLLIGIPAAIQAGMTTLIVSTVRSR